MTMDEARQGKARRERRAGPPAAGPSGIDWRRVMRCSSEGRRPPSSHTVPSIADGGSAPIPSTRPPTVVPLAVAMIWLGSALAILLDAGVLRTGAGAVAAA